MPPLQKLKLLEAAERKRREAVLKVWPTAGAYAAAFEPETRNPPHLQLVDDALRDVLDGSCERLIVTMPPQEGKALALDAPVPTPSGWSTMGALTVGDEVFDRHGRVCRVTWKSPVWTDRPCYAVTTRDGERIVADARHEWVARLDRRRAEHVYETTALARGRVKAAQVTAGGVLDLPDADLPLDPYVLGAWLGDGHSRGAMLTSSALDAGVQERIRAAGFPCRRTAKAGEFAWSLAPEGGSSRPSPIRQALVALGVWGNKHVPAAYLRGSRAQRLALLQGLVDTDGHVTAKGQVEFTSTLRTLSESVAELVYSLGAKAVLTEGPATIGGRVVGTRFRVRFYLACAAHLARKAERCKDSSVAAVRYVSAVEVPSVPVQCIEVDSPDHTFLVGRTMLPTHNSQRISHWGAEWMLVANPELRMAVVSYDEDAARRWGQVIRNDFLTFKLPLRLRQDTRAAGSWQIDGHRGNLYCVGIGGPLSGRPVDVLIVDDPVKDREQADSAVYRERAWNWFTDVARPRLAPHAAMIVVSTRWHEEDLTGRLLSGANSHEWRHLHIRAQAEAPSEKRPDPDPLGREHGEYIPSARNWPEGRWESVKRDIGSRAWNALYQGDPAPADGDVWKKEWWSWYDLPLWVQRDDQCWMPDGYEVIMSWDMAFKDTRTSDYVVGQVWAKKGGSAFLLDQVRERMGFTATQKAVAAMVRKWPQAHAKLVEDKANGTAILETLKAVMPGLVPITPKESKMARAAAVSPFIESRNVWLPRFAQFSDDLVEEAAAFPNGAHDDAVDSASQALSRLFVTGAPRARILV